MDAKDMTLEQGTAGRTFQMSDVSKNWQLLFKVNLVLVPVLFTAVLAWGQWVTRAIIVMEAEQEASPKFSASDARILDLELTKKLETELFRRHNETQLLLSQGFGTVDRRIARIEDRLQLPLVKEEEQQP